MHKIFSMAHGAFLFCNHVSIACCCNREIFQCMMSCVHYFRHNPGKTRANVDLHVKCKKSVIMYTKLAWNDMIELASLYSRPKE